jgi:hypothetical protein
MSHVRPMAIRARPLEHVAFASSEPAVWSERDAA